MRELNNDLNELSYKILAEMSLQAYYENKSCNKIEYFYLHKLSNEYVSIYVSEELRKVVIAIRGTIWTKLRDFFINITIILGIEKFTMRYKLYRQIIRTINFLYPSDKGYKIYLTAHSQGGSMARRLTLQHYNHITKCIIFNPGFSIPHLYEAIIGKQFYINTNKTKILLNKVIIYRVKGDLVSYFSKWSISPIIHITSHNNSFWGSHSIKNFIEYKL